MHCTIYYAKLHVSTHCVKIKLLDNILPIKQLIVIIFPIENESENRKKGFVVVSKMLLNSVLLSHRSLYNRFLQIRGSEHFSALGSCGLSF